MAELTAPSPATRLHPHAGAGRPRQRRSLRPWQWLAAPFWLGSEVPVFSIGADAVAARDLGPAGEVVRRGLDQLRNRLWRRHAVHLLVRALWLTLAIGCVWQLIAIAGGPELNWRALPWIGAPLVILALAFAIVNRPGRRHTARMLDRSFHLHDRLMTALDHLGQRVPREGERTSVVYLQIADAANVIEEVKRHRALRFGPPVRELVPTLGFALILTALYFWRGTGEGIPAVAAASVPKFTPAVARQAAPESTALSPENTALAPTVEEVIERSRQSSAAQQDLSELAAALSDHAVTRPAADAIFQGDYAAAARLLRELAPSSDELSPAAREALARDLDAAAGDMSPQNDDLRRATDQAATGLRDGGERAETGVRELGDAVDRTGDKVASPQELADQMQRAQETERRQQQQSRRGPAGESDSQSGGSEQAQQPGEGERESGAQEGGQDGPGDGERSTEGGQPGTDTGDASGGRPGDQAQRPGENMAGQGGGQPAPLDEAAGAVSPQEAEGGQSSEGAGAASGEGEGDSSAQRRSGGGDEAAPEASEVEQRVTDASGDRVQAEEAEGTSSEVQLPAAPGGDGIQTVNNAGGAVRGSGAGVTAGSGNAVQADVAEAGPDSNRVPEEYRPVVERYFSNVDDD